MDHGHQWSAMDCSSDEPVQDQEVFVWPWMGILANVPADQTQGGPAILMNQLADFKPVQYTVVDGANGHTGYVIVRFTNNWTGFKNALEFHNYFKSQHLGKLDWKKIKQHIEHVFGWLAKEEDYKSDDPVGRYLSANGDLKTVPELEQEMSSKIDNLIANLTKQITAKSKYLQELECKCNEMNLFLQKLMEESDLLHKRYNEEEMKRMQFVACERKKQQKADERKLQLLEKHKKEESALNITLQLERLVDEKQKLELDIKQLKGKLEVVKYMEGEGIDVKRSEELTAELNERIEEMEDLDALNQTLVVKERMTNDEIQDAKKELITGLTDLLGPRSNIGIKRMGELDQELFILSCKERYGEGAEMKAAELVSVWQDHLKDPNWHPFKIVITGSTTEQIIDDMDEKLMGLKEQFGEEVYKAVTTALLYNASGSHVVAELWNNKKNRKASMAEAIKVILKQLRAQKRRLTGTS